MDLKIVDEIQATSWGYLPDTDTLLGYLNRKGLIELSKCCKRYRKQLERRVLGNLSLSAWENNNREIHNELKVEENINKILEFLETDLATKLKFVKRFTLYCEVDCEFAQIFVKLLPNIKALTLIIGLEEYAWLGEGLATILMGMKQLEHVYLDCIDKLSSCFTKKQYFSKSLKSLKIRYYDYPIEDECELSIHNTIDASYKNLNFLTISSNRMLENLSSGIPNLKEVEIQNFFNLDVSKLLVFLNSNSQLRKLSTRFDFPGEYVKTVLSSKYLQHWCVRFLYPEYMKICNLPSNYSIKYLEFRSNLSALLTLNIINACKNLETLDFGKYPIDKKIDLSKFEQKINTLKLSIYPPKLNIISEIDTSKLFNQVHITKSYHTARFITKDDIGKLSNYKLIHITSNSLILKLINKTK